METSSDCDKNSDEENSNEENKTRKICMSHITYIMCLSHIVKLIFNTYKKAIEIPFYNIFSIYKKFK